MALKFFATPVPWLVLAMGFYFFAPDVGSHATKLFSDASEWLMFIAALAYNPTAVLARLGIPPSIPTTT